MIFSSKLAFLCIFLIKENKDFFFLRKSCDALEQSVRGGGGVTVPGAVQGTWKCGTEGHGLVGMVGMGWWLELMFFEIFSNLTCSMTL